jgi:TetR/AcrR family transcriptional regulator, mexCD-oprJ operon repressor
MSIHSGGGGTRDEPEVRRRADAERNLHRIVESATTVLAENRGASVAEIADAAGVVRATVYRHFPTREDLLRAIYATALGEAGKAILDAKPERGSSRTAIARVVDALLLVGDRYRILSEEAPGGVYPELRDQAEGIAVPLFELAARGQSAGELRDDLSPRWLVAALGALINEALRAVGRGDIERADAGRIVTTTFLESMRARRR